LGWWTGAGRDEAEYCDTEADGRCHSWCSSEDGERLYHYCRGM
jgi:hypothetical protein